MSDTDALLNDANDLMSGLRNLERGYDRKFAANYMADDIFALVPALSSALREAEKERDLNAESLRLTSDALQNEEDRVDEGLARERQLREALREIRKETSPPLRGSAIVRLGNADDIARAALVGQHQEEDSGGDEVAVVEASRTRTGLGAEGSAP